MAGTVSTSRAGRTPVYGLDLVRFAAAMLVAVYHLGFKAWAIEGGTLNGVVGALDLRPAGYGFTWCGWIGVQVFFVVSGAVIAYSARGVSERVFAARRLARLLPALTVAVALAIPVSVAVFGMEPGRAVWLAFKTLAFAPWGPWIIGQFWTIPVEVSFYALVFLMLAVGRGDKGVRVLAWGLGMASCAYWLAVVGGIIAPGGRLAEVLLLQHGIYFAFGALCAGLGEPRDGMGSPGAAEALLAIACAAAASAQIRAAAGWEMGDRLELAARWPLAWAIWLVLALTVGGAFLWRDAVAARWSGAAGALRLLGLSTYPLYLIHIHVGGTILLFTRTLGPAWACLCALAGSAAFAFVIAAWIEPPLHALVRGAISAAGHGGRAMMARLTAG